MENFKWEIFTNPPYSPELAPSDFHLYPALKWHLRGKHFANDDEVQAEANHWLRRQDTAWYNSGPTSPGRHGDVAKDVATATPGNRGSPKHVAKNAARKVAIISVAVAGYVAMASLGGTALTVR
ncbi:hypothetical protein LAZ67_9002275 [Cordylochernes scorpioides]|uniref:Uncharacterized protein n=1 Tax=Cordylochernes scorpioides TaxID=51811 RepID=A0ABY6KTP7_9ARAC|nr:hypothetical protein LAZ67_9002275 [Cordylochernes scorpioides]